MRCPLCSKPSKVKRWDSAPSEGNTIEVAMNVYSRKAFLHELSEATFKLKNRDWPGVMASISEEASKQ